jgi:hypothetical protein
MDTSHNLFTADGAAEVVRDFVNTYFRLSEISVDKMWFQQGHPEPLMISCKFNNGETAEFSLSPEDFGPFAPNPSPRFIQSLQSTTMSFKVQELELTYRRLCIETTVQHLLNNDVGTMKLTIVSSSQACPGALLDSPTSIELVLSSLTTILALGSLGHLLMVVNRNKHSRRRWLCSYRFLFLACTDVLLLVQSLTSLLGGWIQFSKLLPDQNSNLFSSFILMGTAFALAWFRLTVEIGSLGGEFSVLYRILSAVAPALVKLIVGIIPVYVGTFLFAFSYFGLASPSYVNVMASSDSLFSIMTGDSMLAFFQELQYKFPLVSRLFYYVVAGLFSIFIVQMVLVGIEFYVFLHLPKTKAPVDTLSVLKESGNFPLTKSDMPTRIKSYSRRHNEEFRLRSNSAAGPDKEKVVHFAKKQPSFRNELKNHSAANEDLLKLLDEERQLFSRVIQERLSASGNKIEVVEICRDAYSELATGLLKDIEVCESEVSRMLDNNLDISDSEVDYLSASRAGGGPPGEYRTDRWRRVAQAVREKGAAAVDTEKIIVKRGLGKTQERKTLVKTLNS